LVFPPASHGKDSTKSGEPDLAVWLTVVAAL
jgi:hypothetical protein